MKFVPCGMPDMECITPPVVVYQLSFQAVALRNWKPTVL